jgi:bacterioferritin (cytochrome b1)
MSLPKSWSESLSGLFGIFSHGRQNALKILTERYTEASRHAQQLSDHAEHMQYPQFRNKLRAIAENESRHAQWIAEKIRSLGGLPPEVQKVSFADKNSWEYLRADLEEHRKCTAELLLQVYSLRADFPEVADTLQRIYDEGVSHRDEIREMLMRSDPQANLAA